MNIEELNKLNKRELVDKVIQLETKLKETEKLLGIKDELHTIDDIIMYVLKQLKCKPNISGTVYLKECIAYYIDKYTDNSNIAIKVIIRELANKYNINPTNYERCVRYSLEQIYKSADENIIKLYCGNTRTLSDFIPSVSEYIIKKYKTLIN